MRLARERAANRPRTKSSDDWCRSIYSRVELASLRELPALGRTEARAVRAGAGASTAGERDRASPAGSVYFGCRCAACCSLPRAHRAPRDLLLLLQLTHVISTRAMRCQSACL